MLSKNLIYRMILSKEFGIKEEHDVESGDVIMCIYDKKYADRPVLIKTTVLSEGDSACWISSAIRYGVRQLKKENDINKNPFKMDRLAELEEVVTELEEKDE